MKETVIDRIQKSISKRIEYLEELDKLGVLHVNEMIHKTNELKGFQTKLADFRVYERQLQAKHKEEKVKMIRQFSMSYETRVLGDMSCLSSYAEKWLNKEGYKENHEPK